MLLDDLETRCVKVVLPVLFKSSACADWTLGTSGADALLLAAIFFSSFLTLSLQVQKVHSRNLLKWNVYCEVMRIGNITVSHLSKL